MVDGLSRLRLTSRHLSPKASEQLNPLETKRLLLRSPTSADIADYLAYRNNPGDVAASGIAPASEDEARNLLQEQEKLSGSELGWRMLAVEVRDQIPSQRMIGEVGVFLSPDGRETGDVGWWLHPDTRGRGFATEAANGLLRWCFVTLGLHRVTAACLAQNTPSLRMMEKLGMRVEGRRQESRKVAGQWLDEIECALLRREWEARD